MSGPGTAARAGQPMMRTVTLRERTAARRGMRARLPRLAAAMMGLLTAPAAASEVYNTGDPYDGQEISHSPSQVLIRFTEPVRMEDAVLQDEAGRQVAVRFAAPNDARGADAVLVHVADPLPPGQYRLHWLVYVPSHRHADDGTVRFTILPSPGEQADQ